MQLIYLGFFLNWKYNHGWFKRPEWRNRRPGDAQLTSSNCQSVPNMQNRLLCVSVCLCVCLSACVCVCVCGGWFSLFPTPSEGFQSPGWRGGGGGGGGVSEAAGTWTLRPMKTMGVLYRGHPSAVQLLAHSWWEECSHQSSNKRHRYRKVAGGTWLFPTSITL